jgi:hypothetical protein
LFSLFLSTVHVIPILPIPLQSLTIAPFPPSTELHFYTHYGLITI